MLLLICFKIIEKKIHCEKYQLKQLKKNNKTHFVNSKKIKNKTQMNL